ncbi:MAG: type II CRISPR-associated endonuclease Cas1 [Firmicutes bacterium]|nr:type II CRISPR-associated endonuclease Cas1 [Bacillota bacterium]
MRYISVLLSDAKSISVANEQLKIVKDTNEFRYPLEDVNVVILEKHFLSISSYTLYKFAEHGIACIICDQKHLPNGILMPYNTHFKKPEVLKLQIEAPKPLQKRMWQALIKQKILNQSKCLLYSNKNGAFDLEECKKNVQSGDALNMEAVAARKYFGYLLGSNFSREQENFKNSALNYAYSIVRGAICRSLAAYGFEPCLGVGHKSMLNAFNLADDIMEPFRAICDLLVMNIEECEDGILKPMHKQKLVQILQVSCKVEDEIVSVSYAIEKCISSFKRSLENKEEVLVLPELIELKIQRYE